ncbi:hypothetical protein RB2501_14074 [Robiginitalea biformata HTCC2501]|uniref:Tyr recombinase domain-containing protein n=2 Tax=Robiginitalea TaxID=252306 RepID=A4CKR2_ROBBH|nr:hypothetical protein RB2501_14074 [Robiginitalea biformata HTCC2501]
MYSEVKIYIPKKMVGGKAKPDLSKQWYVYFYFRDPITGKMGRQPFKTYRNINQGKTIKERKAIARAWVNTITGILEDGFNPYDEDSARVVARKRTDMTPSIRQAFTEALEHKKATLKPNTYKSYWHYLNPFLEWIKRMGIGGNPIESFTQRHAIAYMNYLADPKPYGKELHPNSVSNHKGNLSAIFSKVVQDRWADRNFFVDIQTKKVKPRKNQPFTKEEMEAIQAYTKEFDPLLYNFLRFIFYSFMRNREILSVQVKHIDMKKRTVAIETKADKISHILMIEPMYQFLEDLGVGDLPDHYHIFTPSGKPGHWPTNPRDKVNFFAKRFRAVRDHLGIDPEKTTYSFRHNAALDLFQSMIEDGMPEREVVARLMKITRHRSEEALRKYLRDIGGVLPEDWSATYRTNF